MDTVFALAILLARLWGAPGDVSTEDTIACWTDQRPAADLARRGVHRHACIADLDSSGKTLLYVGSHDGQRVSVRVISRDEADARGLLP